MSDKKTRLTRLTFTSIDGLADGQAADAVDRAIQRALADLDRYGHDGATRKVVVEIGLKKRPVPGRFVATFLARENRPGERQKTTTGYVEKEGDTIEALFAEHSAANPDQLPIPFEPPAAVAPEVAPTETPAKTRKKGGAK